jgi:hypothetical protein
MFQIPIMPPTAHGDLAHSALPEAPVVPDRPRRQRFRGARAALADALRTAARAVEPAQHRAPLPARPGMRA